MRLVHVASGRLFGGIEQMLVTLARERAVTPDVALTFAVAAPDRPSRLPDRPSRLPDRPNRLPDRPNRLIDELRTSGADVHALGDVRLRRPMSIVQARSRLRRLLVGARPDAVICHAPWSHALFAPVARRLRLPLVFWQHDRAEGRSIVERWAERTPADLVICNSAWTSRTAEALQPGVPVTIIHPPVIVPPWPCPEPVEGPTPAALRSEFGAAPADVVILSASRLEPWKGHMNLVRALGRLRTGCPWTLWIAGAAERPHEQQYLADLRLEVSGLGIGPRVRFLGERRDVPTLMRAIDLFCQPNDGPEPFGVVFAESLLSGVPVVTVDMGGAPEIVSDECGRLVPAGDIDALARVLDELIENARLRARLGARGPAHAMARCAPDVVLPQIARALNRLGRAQTA